MKNRDFVSRARACVRLLPLAFSAAVSTSALADDGLSLAPVFSDYAVLQRDRLVPVWGHAAQGAEVQVSLGGQTASTKAGPDGAWRVDVPAQGAGADVGLTVSSGSNQLSLPHVSVGDVWLCSGQSNMEFEVRKATNADVEMQASADAGLRLLLVPKNTTATPQADFAVPTVWQAAGPESVREFSAACFFMGQKLRADTGVPVGLIASSWGGSVIQEWISKPRLQAIGGYDDGLELLALHGTDPDAAAAKQGARLAAWLDARIGAAQWGAPISIGQDKAFWEDWGVPDFAGFDGIAKFEATVTLSKAQREAAVALVLGRVDDSDQTMLNGALVGSDSGWDRLRRYPVKPSQLKVGQNTISSVVIDTGGGGGIWGPEARGIELKDGTIVPFDGNWSVRRGPQLAGLGNPPLVPWQAPSGLTTLYNGMIAPLEPYAVKGYAWYQGESNVAEAKHYETLLTTLIDDWRQRFGGSQFLVVQLAGHGPMQDHPYNPDWAHLRETQRRVVEADAQTALIPAIDVGDIYDIHPTNKREVGRRLALAVERTDGNRVGTHISAARSGDGVDISLGREVRLLGGSAGPVGFELCNSTGACRYVDARLVTPDTVRLTAMAGDTEVRYLWADSPVVTLFDLKGVPVPPFRLSLAD
ncbi:MAG: sialate O-acetylesterase [Alphaproteobacteria bacterium]|nr:MAG: sialate O-acetylesterase [Alphaproteobacteria bacterium]